MFIVKSNCVPDATLPDVNEDIVAVIVLVDEVIAQDTATTFDPAVHVRLALEVGNDMEVGNLNTTLSPFAVGV